MHYMTQTLATTQATAELIAQKWRSLGVQVKLTHDTATDLNRVMFQTSDYDVYIDGFGVDLPSQMIPYLSGPVPPKGTNLAGIHNTRYETLVTKAEALTPPAACAYWNQAEQALYRDLDPAPISNTSRPWFLHNAHAQVSGVHYPIPTSIRVLR
jgi:peptide/nickel transport system substrate-binding protein